MTHFPISSVSIITNNWVYCNLTVHHEGHRVHHVTERTRSSSKRCTRTAVQHHKLTMTVELVHVVMCTAGMHACISVGSAAERGCLARQSEAEQKSKPAVVGDKEAIKHHLSDGTGRQQWLMDGQVTAHLFPSRRHDASFQLRISTQPRQMKKMITVPSGHKQTGRKFNPAGPRVTWMDGKSQCKTQVKKQKPQTAKL